MLLGTYVAPSTYQGLGAFFKENVLDKALLTVDRGANTQVCICVYTLRSCSQEGWDTRPIPVYTPESPTAPRGGVGREGIPERV